MVPVNLDRPATSLKWRTLFYQAFEVPVLDPLAEAAPNATPGEEKHSPHNQHPSQITPPTPS